MPGTMRSQAPLSKALAVLNPHTAKQFYEHTTIITKKKLKNLKDGLISKKKIQPYKRGLQKRIELINWVYKN
jgi:hypothetical protein